MAKRKKEARRLAKAIGASPEFRRLADVMDETRRLDEAVAKARRSDPYRAYVHGLAKSGNPAARAELDRTRADALSSASISATSRSPGRLRRTAVARRSCWTRWGGKSLSAVAAGGGRGDRPEPERR